MSKEQLVPLVAKATEVLLKGGTILYPTDTVWGLGCDATNVAAIKEVYNIKQRDITKSCIILVPNTQTLLRYLAITPIEINDIIKNSERATTFIFNHACGLPDELIHKDGTIAVRIPKDPFCKQLLMKFKRPIVSTSANLSKDSTPSNYSEISDFIKQSVTHIVPYRQNELTVAQPSRIVKVDDNGQLTIIRK